jgi:putative photosynthetic complex assembly protein
MSDQMTDKEMLRYRRKENMIPAGLFYAMIALVVTALGITTFASVTDRPLVGVPQDAEILAQRAIILDGTKAGDVTVRDESGQPVLVLGTDQGGFVSVIWRGMDRKRMLHGIEGNPPVNLVEYANGRLSLQDPASGWSAELASFGALNEAAFTRLLD